MNADAVLGVVSTAQSRDADWLAGKYGSKMSC